MPAAIPSGLTDDNQFIDILNSMLKKLLVQNAPDCLWIIQIDNWFDHKWLRFSGLGTHALFPSVGPVNLDTILSRVDSTKVEFYQDGVTFPPFAPERILGQWSFLRSGSDYIEAPLPELPHNTERRPIRSNMHNRIEKRNDTALFIWFSGNTLKNGRGSVMVYNFQTANITCWFASFVRNEDWTIERTKEISRLEMLHLVAD
jgi:hypothetical protein